MRKIFLFVLSLVLILGLVACGNNSNNIYTTSFKARIVESNGNTVIVEPLENEDIRRSADKISMGIGKIKELVPEVLPVGTLVEIVYDGNINETYPAQINVLGFRTIMEENEIPTIVAYANWSPNESELLRECLNSEMMTISSVRHLPIFKFETKAELDEFKNKYKDAFTMDQGYDESLSFNEETANYDEDFFKDHTLMLTYIAASSGSFRYGVSEVKKENGTLMMVVTQLNNPEVYTDDMSGWFLMAEAPKEYLKDCTKFDAQFVKETNTSTVTTEDTIIIPNGKNEKTLQHKIRIGKFVENTKRGIDDEIKIIQYTIEGDPITKVIRYNSKDGTFEMITDTTQDKFGMQEVTTKTYDKYYQARIEKFSDDDTNRFHFHLVSGTVNVSICIFVCQPDEVKEKTLPVGHIETGDFSYIELWNNVSKDNPAVKTDGFVNTNEVELSDATERAKAEVTIDYNLTQKFYDKETDMWMIRFGSSTRAGGDETVYLNGKGVTQLIVYGE